MVLTCPLSALADDIAIYGTQSVTIEPNVLIIFDTSGSMAETVEGSAISDGVSDTYDPATVYSGAYPSRATYYKSGSRWYKYSDDVSAIDNDAIEATLLSVGYAEVTMRSGRRKWKTWMRIGNYINFLNRPVVSDRTRLEIAQGVVKELLAETTGVRFGLMELNSCSGGRLISACGTSNAIISDKVDALAAYGGTPLAEALAEAGLYFAGRKGYFSHTTSNYVSPIEYSCQKNYVILFTDGEATCDESSILYGANRYMGKTIGDYDKDGKDLNADGSVHRYPSDDSYYGTTDFLDDVAMFLYGQDLLSPMGTGTSFVKQNIITHTIGFTLDHDLLNRAATDGGGTYHTASRASDLKEAFEQIMSTIAEESSTFVAPVVPVNREYRTAEADSIYLAFFKPVQFGDWKGNLKKYTLSASGDIIDALGNNAVNTDGTMKENSRSLWTTAESDGADVLKGGAGERIQEQATRHFYTYTGTTQKNLIDTVNRFDATNTDLIDLGVTTDSITAVKVGAGGWPIGSIIHSEPVVVHYSTSSSVIYFGSNDGLFRAIDDASGEELWAFVPPGQLDRLNLLTDNNYDYYVDGSPAVSYGDLIDGTTLFEPNTVLVGERRGGYRYYALDISSSSEPKWKYEVTSAGGEALGQTWGRPVHCRIKLSSTTDAKVFILPGGYNQLKQEANSAVGSIPEMGRALFAVKASDGSFTGLKINHGNWSSMTHSIVDLYAVDADADGITTRVYAGDMAGQVFVVADDIRDTVEEGNRVVEDKAPDGTWAYRNHLFTCSSGKLFYAPVPADVAGVEILYFGTGNRAFPLGTESNRFYGVRNTLWDSGLTDSDLVNVTDETVSYTNVLTSKKGWYFNLPYTNEKVVSRALVNSGVVYFTTYTPTSETSFDSDIDPCAGAGARGIGRLYAVSAIDGKAVTTWGKTSKFRSIELPGNLPIAKPVFNGTKVQVGPMNWDAAKDDRVDYFYWKQRP